MSSVIQDSLDGLDAADRAAIEHVYALARTLVPEAEEGVSYGMAALLYRGRGLVAVRRTKAGLSLYPFSGKVIAAIAEHLAGFEHTTGSIHFDAAHPLPDDVLHRILTVRRAEIDAARSR